MLNCTALFLIDATPSPFIGLRPRYEHDCECPIDGKPGWIDRRGVGAGHGPNSEDGVVSFDGWG